MEKRLDANDDDSSFRTEMKNDDIPTPYFSAWEPLHSFQQTIFATFVCHEFHESTSETFIFFRCQNNLQLSMGTDSVPPLHFEIGVMGTPEVTFSSAVFASLLSTWNV